jgi:predicted transcriptional regulator
MSIHPEFADRILRGEKRVEFRRRAAAKQVTHIVIYATSPVCAVVGVAEIERIEHAAPGVLWKSFGESGGIGRSDFFSYFAGTDRGSAYVVKRAFPCAKPVALGERGLPETPPQTFQYVDEQILEAVLGPPGGHQRYDDCHIVESNPNRGEVFPP